MLGGKGEAVVPLGFQFPSMPNLISRYNLSFSGINIVRDNFGNVIHLSPIGFRLSSLYRVQTNSPPNVGAIVFRCKKYPYDVQTRVMNTQNNDAENEVEACGGDLGSILGIIGFRSVRDMAFAVKTNGYRTAYLGAFPHFLYYIHNVLSWNWRHSARIESQPIGKRYFLSFLF